MMTGILELLGIFKKKQPTVFKVDEHPGSDHWKIPMGWSFFDVSGPPDVLTDFFS